MRCVKSLLSLLVMLVALTACLSSEMIPGTGAPGGPAQLTDVSAREAQALNALRARHGLKALGVDPVLVRIARGHAQDMMTNRFFGHVSSNGNTIVERTRAQGYAFCHVGENLAMGQVRFGDVLQQWMGSPSHRSNVLHEGVDDFGLIQGPGNLWVMVVGSSGC